MNLQKDNLVIRNVNADDASILCICNFNQQGKGYGTQFLKMLIDFLFNQVGYKKSYWILTLKNIRAQHVYEQIGFQKVAVNIDSWRNQLGELQSSIDYELTREDCINNLFCGCNGRPH